MNRALERLHPANALTALEQEMDHFMNKFFGRHTPGYPSQALVPSPDLEMLDKDSELVVKAELPGLAKSDIQVSIDGDLLTIKGEKNKEKETKEESYYFSECSYGAFSRSLRLPVQVQPDKVAANLSNGVLEIHLPKAENAKRTQVNIAVAG